MAKVRSKTDALVSSMSCRNPNQAEIVESEIQIEPAPLRRRQTPLQVNGMQNNRNGNLAAYPGLQEAMIMSLQDEEEKHLQRAIALSLAEAEDKNKASSMEKSKPVVYDDLIDIGQHDLLDLADPAPASTTELTTTEKDLFDVFPTEFNS